MVVNDGIPAADSVSLQRVDTITLHTGHGIKAIPTCSQLLDDSCVAKYIVLDKQKLNIFDLDADSLIAVVDVSECGGLQNYSGFHCAPDGKSYLYDYGNKTLSVVNPEGKILNAYEIPDEVMKDVSPEPIDGSHIIIENGMAILSGLPMSGKTRFSKDDPISMAIDLNAGRVKTGASFSDEYSKAYFGGLYFNTIYQCKGDHRSIVYSFPASNYIYRYDSDLCLIDSLYMGSRYTKEIHPTDASALDILQNKEKRLDYYLDENSYSSIAFDERNGLYYRIANHPREGKDKKPFSIIVMDVDGNLLSETPVVEDYSDIITVNSHVYRDGLLLQLRSEDEGVMKFVYYRLTK